MKVICIVLAILSLIGGLVSFVFRLVDVNSIWQQMAAQGNITHGLLLGIFFLLLAKE